MKIQVNQAATALFNESKEAEGRKDFARAAELCLRAIELDPRSALLRNKLVSWLYSARQWDRVISEGDEALRVAKARLDEFAIPSDPSEYDYDRNLVFRLWVQIRARIANALLTVGDFDRGWKEYESRLEIFDLAGQNVLRSPEEVGRYRDGTIAIRYDAGIGDSIHFSRYFPFWQQRCATLILQTHRELIRLFELNFPFAKVIGTDDALPPEAGVVPVMSQPFLLGLGAPDKQLPFPYLTCGELPRQRAERPVRIGFKPKGSQRDLREFDIQLFKPLLELPDVEIHLLEKDPLRPEEQEFLSHFPIHYHVIEFTDLLATAKFVNSLDLVVAVDTAVAHLAGALAVPTWVLIPWEQDWRWGVDPERTWWYPTMRLFRQQRPGEWSDVMAKMARELV